MNMCTTASPPRPKLVVGPARRRQSGIATVLVILLTGLALATVVLGAVGYIGSLQARSVSLHASTQAQLQAWSAQEAARQYLSQLTSTELSSLTAPTTMTFASSYLSGVTATVTAVTPNDATYCGGNSRVQMTFAGKGGPARSTLESVICASGAAAATQGLIGSGSIIKGKLSISGLVTLDPPTVGTDALIVDGDVTNGGSGGTMTGFTSLSSTGNITLTGATANIDNVQANGYIQAEGTFVSLQAIGNVTTFGGNTTATTITSNGAVEIKTGPSSCCTPASYGTIQATGNVQLDQKVGVGTVLTKADIKIIGTANPYILTQAQVQGNYLEGSACTNVASGNYGGAITYSGGPGGACATGNTVKMTKQAGLVVSVPTVPPVTAPSNKVDAYYYKSAANYVFDSEIDSVGSTTYWTTVTVNKVNGLVDGTKYYLVGDGGGNRDYLCTTKTYSSNTSICPKKICYGVSLYNSCFSATLNASSSSWTFSSTNGASDASTTLAPGVMWFKGDLSLGSGYYLNTFIATGNISVTNATMTLLDPAWAGTSGICNNSRFKVPAPSLYPTNMCVGGNYVDSAIANVALLAGGYVGNVFSGGDINIGTGNTIKGNLIAGDTLTTSGGTKIFGVFSAQHQSNSPTATNSFGQATEFDQTNLKVFPGTGTNGGAGAAGTAQVLFSHYQ